ncbi:probable homoserine O-acetyltransferase [Fusarium mangiferae]|uniref:Probable homoserine O-acetyltransferase n=1 Tax=Fusarium mangiferae TaxID=192010 RepID=A0A1L7UEN4_FUSMA|nr:putative homoserine O-acetyltransferase [Fusarium mangiferae]CVL06465.1 probable homoserine O-acetyltransferase [Fusarium mangiferae]
MSQHQTLRALHKHILSRPQCILISSSGKLFVAARRRMTTTTMAPALPTPIHDGLGNGTTYERSIPRPVNPFSHRVLGREIMTVPNFTLESGVEMRNVPVAYMSWGKLAPKANNVMIICHALSGSADVSDWWGPLLGPGKAFDTDKFFVICMNSLGSPYGTASPVTAKNGDYSEGWYGADFPATTIRDDVRLHKLVLDRLGVRKVAAVVGGSMGGMHVLEWAFFGKDYVRCIVPAATSSHQSAWAIGWGEAQRHAIRSDVKYKNGRYGFDDPPILGLEAARMTALLTYRSRDSLERRFGRGTGNKKKTQNKDGETVPSNSTPIHSQGGADETPVAFDRADSNFAAQSYLRYQAKKFSDRFDSNCYIALTNKLDTHDLARGRTRTITEALSLIEQPTLVLGIRSDGLYTLAEQEQIARAVPNAKLREIVSDDGHDAFLIEWSQLNWLLIGFLHESLPDIMQRAAL